MANLINVERATVGYGTRTLLDAVSLGVDEGDAIGVVGRNGDGKTTLLGVLTGTREPDSGRVTHTSGLSVGYLRQTDDFSPDTSVRQVIVGGRPDHVWAAEPDTREVVEHLLAGVDLDADVGRLSGGERRRVALAQVLLAGHDVLVLDEPTNHLDVEVIGWLAGHLTARRAKALVVVSHDRWFLDAVCTRTWEVHGGAVDAYDGGYAAYVLARAERMRLEAGVRGAPPQPDAQGAGLAAPRSAGSDVEAEVPHPGRQRIDRQRAGSARFACAATVCHHPAGQGRVRSAPAPAGGGRPAAGDPGWCRLVDRARRPHRARRRQRQRQDVGAAAADGRTVPRRRHHQARHHAEDRLPEPGADRT